MASRRVKAIGGLALAAGLMFVAACSSSGATSQSPATSGPPSADTSASSTAGSTAPEVASYLSAPTALPVTVPLSKNPPTGVSIEWVGTGDTQAVSTLNGFKAAASELGWSVHSIVYDPSNPATINTSIESALAQKPAALVVRSLQISQFATEIPKAMALHIPIIDTGSTAKPQPGLYTAVDVGTELAYTAQIVTDALLADAAASGTTAHVLQLTVPAIANVLGTEDNGVKAELQKQCASCTQSLLGINLPDVFNGHYTQQVVSYLQSHPNINYIVSDSGQLENGLGAAMNQAGLTSVKRFGFSPSNVQIKELQGGQLGAWAVQPYQEQGWQTADVIARVLVGDPTQVWDDEHLAYMLTAENSRAVDPDDPEFPSGYQDMFKKMWLK